MKKIPTLFKREFDKRHRIISCGPDFSSPDLGDWVLNDCLPTIKVDGSCCAVIDGVFYKRYDAKKGKPIPEGAIKCQDDPDPFTGHLPCWVKCDRNNPSDKWLWEAYDNFTLCLSSFIKEHNLTYEAIGPHIQGNSYNKDSHILVIHGLCPVISPLKDFESVKTFLQKTPIEGIVWWDIHKHIPIAKIKRSDFGYKWPCEGATDIIF